MRMVEVKNSNLHSTCVGEWVVAVETSSEEWYFVIDHGVMRSEGLLVIGVR